MATFNLNEADIYLSSQIFYTEMRVNGGNYDGRHGRDIRLKDYISQLQAISTDSGMKDHIFNKVAQTGYEFLMSYYGFYYPKDSGQARKVLQENLKKTKTGLQIRWGSEVEYIYYVEEGFNHILIGQRIEGRKLISRSTALAKALMEALLEDAISLALIGDASYKTKMSSNASRAKNKALRISSHFDKEFQSQRAARKGGAMHIPVSVLKARTAAIARMQQKAGK